MEKEKTVSTKRIYDGSVIRVRVDEIRSAKGETRKKEIVEHGGAVVMIPVDSDGNILMIRQFRYVVGKDLLELPAGTIDPGEAPEITAVRELQEEIGYLPGRLEKLGGYYSAPGFCSEYLHLFLATDLKPSRLYAEDTDSIKIEKMSVKDILALVKSGKLEDAKTIAGLMMYLERQKN